MASRHKILLLDDDPELLELYREILSQLPTNPEICTATNGPRGLAMLDADPFTLLVCDLNMPKMDGLQVLSIVRRKFPELRTIVLTSVMDEQFRSRVYGLGVDLFWQKPASNEETKQFLECVESLMGRQGQTGFRGVQSKSLVDIIQLECLSLNSTVLKIINGPLNGRIWIQNGEVIDAMTDGLIGEDAFRRLLSWRAGNFESLPAEPNRTRTIFNSYQGLLLETAQAHDEAHSQKEGGTTSSMRVDANSPLAPLCRCPGVEFVLILKPGKDKKFDVRGLENAQPAADWARQTLQDFRALGERLQVGLLQHLECLGPRRHVALAPRENVDFCVGWQNNLSGSQIWESMKKVLALWVS